MTLRRRTLLTRAHAKVNLDLRVLGTRPDGFHELRTVFQAIELHDTLVSVERRGPFNVKCRMPGVPLDENNLVWRAAAGLWKALGRSGPPCVSRRVPASRARPAPGATRARHVRPRHGRRRTRRRRPSAPARTRRRPPGRRPARGRRRRPRPRRPDRSGSLDRRPRGTDGAPGAGAARRLWPAPRRPGSRLARSRGNRRRRRRRSRSARPRCAPGPPSATAVAPPPATSCVRVSRTPTGRCAGPGTRGRPRAHTGAVRTHRGARGRGASPLETSIPRAASHDPRALRGRCERGSSRPHAGSVHHPRTGGTAAPPLGWAGARRARPRDRFRAA